MKVLVTGSNGFVGSHLCNLLARSGMDLVKAVRFPAPGAVAVGSICGETDWSKALQGVDVVVHTAARVHMLNDAAVDPMTEFQTVNVEGTINLAQQAAQCGVSRFIFISSIAVHGLTSGQKPFSPADKPDPHDAYGFSKYEAEKGLVRICSETGMEQVIIRPPLVYGPGVGANFLRLLKLADCALPLPLGGIVNRRSPVFVGNLCDLIRVCLTHPAAANQIFLVSDDQDVSTPGLVRRLAAEIGRPDRLFPVPTSLLRIAGGVTGRSGEIARLCGSLQLDISCTKQILGWAPPFTMDAGIEATVKDYMESATRKKQKAVMKRSFDVLVSGASLIALSPLFLAVALMVKLTSKGPVFHVSDRVGRNNKIFRMLKFRTMRTDTPHVATHLMGDPAKYLTPVGGFLRKTSLDELPQFLNVFRGQMSLVGPRPALFNQDDLVALRTEKGVHRLLPGITGWAQINGRDELPIPKKVALDAEYLSRRSFRMDLKILILTFVNVLRRDGVSH